MAAGFAHDPADRPAEKARDGHGLETAFGRIRALRTGPARAAVTVFAIRIAAAGLAYVAQVLMARLMGGSEYGIFATVWVWIAILGHASTLGLSQGACRFLPGSRARGAHAETRGFLIGGAAVTALTGLAVAALGLALALGGPALAEAYRWPVVLAALVLPLFAFQDFCEGVARSHDWAVLAIAPPYLLRQGLVVVAMLGAILCGAPAEASVALACALLATGLSAAIQAALLLRRLAAILPSGPRLYRWRVWLGAGLPIAATDLAGAAFGFVDVVVLGFLMPAAAVGLYFAATRIQQLVLFVHFAASAATAQRFSATQAAGDRNGLAALVTAQARATCAATFVIGSGIVAAGPLLLSLFGPDFAASQAPLAILVAGSVAASLFGPGEDLLTMLGGERLCAAITIGLVGVAALLCLALVPWLGVNGAALAMAAASILRAAALAHSARALHGLATPVWSGRRARTPS
ncbi:O-antigen/teichoic acid export membrane protein [Methylobacterium sp. BE186]|uniref:lipopolysaccharide biosynthesis protein n=1 Tax=Methylobacterium sp. BE186 TaxID=2817715 RepID=UPI00286585DC|nr:oligosaccharide flippase family protein [Methylobacterium sp. BE186]MDR7037985.1 O-antigen/teichoic acid export membrane protein [Methylobacterium sp. BE186]